MKRLLCLISVYLLFSAFVVPQVTASEDVTISSKDSPESVQLNQLDNEIEILNLLETISADNAQEALEEILPLLNVDLSAKITTNNIPVVETINENGLFGALSVSLQQGLIVDELCFISGDILEYIGNANVSNKKDYLNAIVNYVASCGSSQVDNVDETKLADNVKGLIQNFTLSLIVEVEATISQEFKAMEEIVEEAKSVENDETEDDDFSNNARNLTNSSSKSSNFGSAGRATPTTSKSSAATSRTRVPYDGITSPGSNHLIDFQTYTNIWRTSSDAGTMFTIENTDPDHASDMVLLNLKYIDDGDANAIFLQAHDNSGDLKLQIGNEGAIETAGTIDTDENYQINGVSVLDISGTDNTFVGAYAGGNNTGTKNTFIGNSAGNYNTTGNDNTFVGKNAGHDNTVGSGNTLIGERAGENSTTANRNTFLGVETGKYNTTGSYNTFLGYNAGRNNTTANNNIYIGYNAGYLTTVGTDNVFVGSNAGDANTTASDNTFIGDNAGSASTVGQNNTFVGSSAGLDNSTGGNNTYLGAYAGENNTMGTGNVFVGYDAGSNEAGSNKLYISNSSTSSPLILGDFSSQDVTINGDLSVTGTINTDEHYKIDDATVLSVEGTENVLVGVGAANSSGTDLTAVGYNAGGAGNNTGNFNTFVGNNAGHDNTTGVSNTFVGYNAGENNTTAFRNTFVGSSAGKFNTTGVNNTYLGFYAGQSSTTASDNTFIGYQAGYQTTTGIDNVFIGSGAGDANTIADDNTFIGDNAGSMNLSGSDNTFIGSSAGLDNSTGNSNTYIGVRAGENNTMGSGNVFIGYDAGSDEAGSNKLYVANSNTSAPLIYGEFDNGVVKINGAQVNKEVVAGDSDTILDVDGANIVITSANSIPTEVVDLRNAGKGQIVRIIGGSNTNSSVINDSGNFNLSAQWTANLDDVLILYVQDDNDYIEIGRVDN